MAVGAHPGFADPEGFGRRPLDLPPEQVFDLVLYQVGALAAFARQAGVRLQHVKPHGALYHLAGRPPGDRRRRRPGHPRRPARILMLIGPPDSALSASAEAHGLRFAVEIFADRQYGEDGRLVPRGQPGAVLELADAAVAARAVAMVREGKVWTAQGTAPGPGGAHRLPARRPPGGGLPRAGHPAALEAAGIAVAPLGSWL